MYVCNTCTATFDDNSPLEKCLKCGSQYIELKHTDHHSSNNFFKLLFIGTVIFVSILFHDQFSFNTSYTQDLEGFEKATNRHIYLSEQASESAIREIYRDFIDKRSNHISEEEFINEVLMSIEGKHLKYQIHGYIQEGNIGYIDRTKFECSDINCEKILTRNRVFRRYNYLNGNWLSEQTPVFCPRVNKHDMQPEFVRALSLVEQRLKSTTKYSTDDLNFISEVINCVKIEYIPNNYDTTGAEGYFRFVPGQSTEVLTIYISPKYSNKDDILTAILISHELNHATTYVNDLFMGITTNCFENEAYAFQAEFAFLTSLNEEEISSLRSRMLTAPSPELLNLTTVLDIIPSQRGSTFIEKALNFLKTDKSYQQQCSST